MDMESEQVCIVLNPLTSSEYEYYIYTMDLGATPMPTPSPVLRLSQEAPVGMAFAMRDGTLYMFGGLMKDDWETCAFSAGLPSPGCCYDLQSLESEARVISQMKFPKCVPRAVCIKDRICVFSSYLTPGGNDFELYDPESDEWSTLPDPPIDFTRRRPNPSGDRVVVVDHYYVDGNNLFVDTVIGSFLFQSEDSVWVPCEVHDCGVEGCTPDAWVKDGDFVFSSDGRRVDGEIERHREEFIPTRKNDQGVAMLVTHGEIGGLPKKKSEKMRVCVVKAGGFVLSDFYEDAFLTVDLVAIDDQAKHTVLKSHMFELDPTIYTRNVFICGIFPM